MAAAWASEKKSLPIHDGSKQSAKAFNEISLVLYLTSGGSVFIGVVPNTAFLSISGNRRLNTSVGLFCFVLSFLIVLVSIDTSQLSPGT
jgi:hypothetical protein